MIKKLFCFLSAILLISGFFLSSFAQNLFEGEYKDFDIGEKSLEIQKTDKNNYKIRLSIYRLAYFDDITAKKVKKGLKFKGTAPNGEKIKGIITIKDNIATVKFLSSFWGEYSAIKEFKYEKISPCANIKPLVQ